MRKTALPAAWLASMRSCRACRQGQALQARARLAGHANSGAWCELCRLAAADLQKAKLEGKALCSLVLCGYCWDVEIEHHKATVVGAHAATLLVNFLQLMVSEPAAQSGTCRLEQLQHCSTAWWDIACSAGCMGDLGQL